MKRLTKDLKRALSALASADAGEMLPRRAMHRHLAAAGHNPAGTQTPTANPVRRRQIALWLTGAPAQSTLDYVIGTCRRLEMDLVLLHPEGVHADPVSEATLTDAGVHYKTHRITGDPRQALLKHLDLHHQIAFVVFSGNDPLLQALTEEFARKSHGMRTPVPFVVVSEARS